MYRIKLKSLETLFLINRQNRKASYVVHYENMLTIHFL